SDQRVYLAHILRARRRLGADDVRGADDALKEARTCFHGASYPAEVRAQLHSLELEVHGRRGFESAAAEALHELVAVLPQVRERAIESGYTLLAQLAGDWHLQAAICSASAGAHDDAVRLLRTGLTLPHLRSGQVIRLKIQLA